MNTQAGDQGAAEATLDALAATQAALAATQAEAAQRQQAAPTEPTAAPNDPTAAPPPTTAPSATPFLVTQVVETRPPQASEPTMQAIDAPQATTPTAVTAALVTQLFFGGVPSDNSLQQGIIKGCPIWDELAPRVKKEPKLPYLHNVGRNKDLGQVCLYGLEPGDHLEIKLRSPDGDFVHTAQFRLDQIAEKVAALRQEDPALAETAGFSGHNGDTPVFSLTLWLPAGLPTGEWQLEARNSQGEQAGGKFQVETFAPQPAIGLTKPHAGPYAAKANPFKRPAVETGCTVAADGQEISVYVVNLPPGGQAVLGIYQVEQTTANLIKELPFGVNQKGNQQVDYKLPNDWPAGRYYFLLPLEANTTRIDKAGPAVCVEISN